jgi:hypothetical protein
VPKTSKATARTAMARAYPPRRWRSGHAYQRMRGIGSTARRTFRGAGRRRFAVKSCLNMFASYDISS